MEKNIFDLFKTIKKEEFGTIAYFAETDSKEEKFMDFEYFAIEKNGMIFYIQNTTISDLTRGICKNFTVTPFVKLDYNNKQQFSFPKGFDCLEELKNICEKEIQEKEKRIMQGLPVVLKDTYKQTIYLELSTYKNTQFGKITLFEYLKKMAGYRELEILKNIDYITMNLNTQKYLVLEIHNKKGQSFAINTKNIDRLIIS